MADTNNVENEINSVLEEIASLSGTMQIKINRLQDLLEKHYSGEDSEYHNEDIYRVSDWVEQNYSSLAYLSEVWA